MGSLIGKVIDKIASFSTKRTKLLMLGLDGAGKTTITFKLQFKEYMETVPTIGFNVANLEHQNLRMTIWDVGYQEKMLEFRRHYYEGTDALIFVVDSCDEERIQVAKDELFGIMDDKLMGDVPVLVFANKQDIGIMTPAQIVSKLELEKWERPWKIQGTCAVTGEGLYEGFDWLSQELKKPKQFSDT